MREMYLELEKISEEQYRNSRAEWKLPDTGKIRRGEFFKLLNPEIIEDARDLSERCRDPFVRIVCPCVGETLKKWKTRYREERDILDFYN